MKHFARCCLFLLVLGGGTSRLCAEPVTITFKGLKLIGEHMVAKGRQPADKTILMLHGTLGHLGMDTIKGLQEVLRERGYNSLSINLSYGLSGRTGVYDCAVPHRHRHGDASVAQSRLA